MTGPRTAVADASSLRAALLRFLAVNERPSEWTFFEGARAGPDIVIERAGCVAYVEVMPQDGGPLPAAKRARERLARRRGTPVFVVRSVPELERALSTLGISLRPPGRMARSLHPGCPQQEKETDHARFEP